MSDLMPLPDVPTRAQIERFEALLMQVSQEHGEAVVPTWHHWADGLVARTIRIEAGVVLTGGVHKSEHLSVCAGDITVWTEGGMRRLTGYHVLPSQPGAKRVGLAHAATYWTSIHANPDNLRDLDALELRLIEDASALQTRRLPLAACQTLEI
jgi:hypothetical protein